MEELGECLNGVSLGTARSKKRIRFSDCVDISEFTADKECAEIRNTYKKQLHVPDEKPLHSQQFSSPYPKTNSSRAWKKTRTLGEGRPNCVSSSSENDSSMSLLHEDILPTPSATREKALFCSDWSSSNGSNPFSIPNKYALPQGIDCALISLRLKRTNPLTRIHTVVGKVLVRNLTFDKSVFARWTLDDWQSFQNIDAVFTEHHLGRSGREGVEATDEFEFSFDVDVYDPASGKSREGLEMAETIEKFGEKDSKSYLLQLAVCYVGAGDPHWDNNNGANYVLVLPN
eukprot:CFRG4205T1